MFAEREVYVLPANGFLDRRGKGEMRFELHGLSTRSNSLAHG